MVHCKEQVTHTTRPNPKHAHNFVWPFKLTTPTGGWRKKVIHFVEGGDLGGCNDKTNELFKKMI